jgi:vancomycin permeability regulator SanA
MIQTAWRFWKSNWRRIAATVLGLGAGVFLWTLWTLTGRFDKRIYPPPAREEIPQRPVAIVFGAGYWPSGALSRVLQDRLDAAIELYHADRVEILLFSGANPVADYNEPRKMLEYALEHWIQVKPCPPMTRSEGPGHAVDKTGIMVR